MLQNRKDRRKANTIKEKYNHANDTDACEGEKASVNFGTRAHGTARPLGMRRRPAPPCQPPDGPIRLARDGAARPLPERDAAGTGARSPVFEEDYALGQGRGARLDGVHEPTRGLERRGRDKSGSKQVIRDVQFRL